jgi:hypothetical protein
MKRGRERNTYIYWELPTDPDQLGGIGLQLLDPTRMRLAHIDGVPSQGIDDVEILAEHIRVLVIFC